MHTHTHYWWSFQINCIFLVQLVIEFNQKGHIDIYIYIYIYRLESRQFKQSKTRVLLRLACPRFVQLKPKIDIYILLEEAWMTYSLLLPSVYVCSSKNDCRLSVTSKKRERGRKRQKKVQQRMSRDRERRQGNDQKESSSRHLFILHSLTHTQHRTSLYSRLSLVFFSSLNVKTKKKIIMNIKWHASGTSKQSEQCWVNTRNVILFHTM
jgi:hypothetical protein